MGLDRYEVDGKVIQQNYPGGDTAFANECTCRVPGLVLLSFVRVRMSGLDVSGQSDGSSAFVLQGTSRAPLSSRLGCHTPNGTILLSRRSS